MIVTVAIVMMALLFLIASTRGLPANMCGNAYKCDKNITMNKIFIVLLVLASPCVYILPSAIFKLYNPLSTGKLLLDRGGSRPVMRFMKTKKFCATLLRIKASDFQKELVTIKQMRPTMPVKEHTF